MALTLNKTKVFRSTLPGDKDIFESVIRIPTPDEESAFLAARSELITKDGKTTPLDASIEARAELFDILVVDIKGTYEDNGETKEFSNENPMPKETLQAICEASGRVMSDPAKGWQVKDAIPKMYKHYCILLLVENMQLDEKTKKK